MQVQRLLASLACAALGLGLFACGDSHTATVSARILAARARKAQAAAAEAEAARTWRRRDSDEDNDFSAPGDDTRNTAGIAEFGPAAGTADRRAITAVLKRYYAAALAGNGKLACSMLYSTYEESVAEDYGQQWSAAYLNGSKTCATVLSRLLAHYHFELAVEVPKLEVIDVRIDRDHALAVLGFAGLPKRQIQLQRERGTWKVAALLDSEVA